MIDKKFLLYFSIFLLWLFNISGIFGILNPQYSNWFLSLTPVNLLLTFTILILNITEKFRLSIVIAFLIPFLLGFITEALGVNLGWIFGTYAYGNNLGVKVVGVPLMICLNWVVLTAITSDIAKYVSKNIWISALIGATLMTLLDVVIEVSAPRFDFWEFENAIVPLQNYFGWLVTAFFAHLGYQYFKVKTNTVISQHIFIAMLIFFGVFLFL